MTSYDNSWLDDLSSDAFQRREAASESKYIHDKELERYVSCDFDWLWIGSLKVVANRWWYRLKSLKSHIDDQRKMLDKLEKTVYVPSISYPSFRFPSPSFFLFSIISLASVGWSYDAKTNDPYSNELSGNQGGQK